MKIHLRSIPPESSLRVEGEEEAGFLGLEEAGMRAVGPLHYSLEASVSEGVLFVTGRLDVCVEMTCVVTLERFEQGIEVGEFVLEMEVQGWEWVDLSEQIREEIHLALPAHPRSAQADVSGGARQSSTSLAASASGVWKALDQIHPPNT